MIFRDRAEAGQKLAEALQKYEGQKDAIVLFLPRGGVVLAVEVVRALDLPMDLVVPRKIGAPLNPEYAVGAITEDGEGIFNEEVVAELGIKQKQLKEIVAQEKKEAQRRLRTYRGDRPPLDLAGQTVIIVDDGIATGLTMRAAIKSVKAKGAAKVIVAVPVAARDSLEKIKREVDEVVCLDTPRFFGAVGAFYQVFGQVEDEEVVELMKAENL
ncbi:MAG: phosphoribosyltransferase [Parcubacteria group bacterium]|nr:phosphoribosyltransferase [Parcubacteria group bacterium]